MFQTFKAFAFRMLIREYFMFDTRSYFYPTDMILKIYSDMKSAYEGLTTLT